MKSVLDRAMELALEHHAGQVNHHDGEPYILHVFRVWTKVRDRGFDERTQAVAWLHDVIEDTDLTLGELHTHFPEDPTLVANVAAITKVKGESNAQYYARLAMYQMAARVKFYGDIVDNFSRNHRIEDDETKLRMAKKYSLGYDMLKDVV